tara:strand:+ start:856 stop:1650 length:795 start_codon:yes stop_codon:yes gene_type:complete
MAALTYTLTYNPDNEGWPSFYSYFPNFIIGMNAYLYTFSGGNLYRHNVNENRNTFYGQFTASTITSVFNPEPVQTIKLFKTLSYESSTLDPNPDEARWDALNLLTDLSQGNVDDLNFERKEGEWYAYIRHNDGVTNFALRYANGLGTAGTIDNADPAAVLVTIDQTLSNILTSHAQAYTLIGGNAPVFAGDITGVDRTNNTITIDTTVAGAVAPSVGNFILFVNNSIAESYGLRGYYMEFKLSCDSTKAVELFSVGSSVMKSYP